MKINKIIAAFALLVTALATAQTPPPEAFVAGSFNIRNPVDKAPNDWRTRKHRLFKTLNEVKFDIFGVQEAKPHQVKDIVANTHYKSVGHGRNPNKGNEANSIFYNPQRFEIIEHETFWLSETPEKPSKSWGSAYYRIATVARVKDKLTNKQFIFANTHLEHRRNYGETRRKQLQVLLDKLQVHIKNNLPVIMTGDMNTTPNTPPIIAAANVLDDAFLLSKTTPLNANLGTCHGYNFKRAHTENKRRIDYVFVSKNTFEVLNFNIIDNFDENKLASSDHFPVSATLLLK